MSKTDGSINSFKGNLPSSFSTLTNLTTLFLQNNLFTGSVSFLATLPFSNLNIQNNFFSGVIPKQFEMIPNLWIQGNMFQTGDAHPLPYISPANITTNWIITHTPTAESSATKGHSSSKAPKHGKKLSGLGTITLITSGGTFVAVCAAVLAIQIYRSHKDRLRKLETIHKSVHTLPISKATRVFHSSDWLSSQHQPQTCGLCIYYLCHRRSQIISRISSSRRDRIPATAKQFIVADLQVATNNFNEDHFLGEGTLGSVYKAKFSDGQTLAVKNINMVTCSPYEEVQVLNVIRKVSHLSLLGYCTSHGQLLVYEYFGNGSLDDALHSAQDTGKPLSWIARVGIALGIARALEYLRWTCSPSIAHGNLKAANILFDDEDMPGLSDCGLAVLRPFVGSKLQASELRIGCTCYTALEYDIPGIDEMKSDIYSFGVIFLELLTGRTPFDRLKVREEQSLVKWASAHLHDLNYLEKVIDPLIKGTNSSKALSQFSDVIAKCFQPNPELRPLITEIVESLLPLLRNTRVTKAKPPDVDDTEMDAYEQSPDTISSCSTSPSLPPSVANNDYYCYHRLCVLQHHHHHLTLD